MRIPALAILAPLALGLGACGDRGPNDANIGRAVRDHMGGARPICLPQYVKLEEPSSDLVDEETAQDVKDLAALGLIQVEREDDVFVMHATARARPFVKGGQLCLAQYRYGKLKSLADSKVTGGGLNTLVAHITPIVEPAPNVPARWLDGLSSIKGIRGMTAEMVQTKEGWKAVSESLY